MARVVGGGAEELARTTPGQIHRRPGCRERNVGAALSRPGAVRPRRRITVVAPGELLCRTLGADRPGRVH